MFAKAASYIKKYDLLRAGDRVVAGVSGGADSVCLLHVLVGLREELGLSVRAVHVHHGLRGEEADRDAAFVEKLAAEWDVPCRVVYADVRGYAAGNGLSEEEAGRLLRYRALREEAERMGGVGVKIAVGHQKEDQAETILHNLFRGSALKGLAGMAPSAAMDGGICIIRPLLGVSRAEIRSYLAENGLSFCEDSTNDTADYTRNRIRRLLPVIRHDVNAQAVEHILAAGERMAQADAYFEKEAARIWEEYGVVEEAEAGSAEETAEKQSGPAETAEKQSGPAETAEKQSGPAVTSEEQGGLTAAVPREQCELSGEAPGERSGLSAVTPDGQSRLMTESPANRCGIPAEVLGSQPEILAGYLAMKMIKRMTGSVKDITSIHAEQICGLARMGTGKQTSLPYGLRAVREYEMIWVERAERPEAGGTEPRKGRPAAKDPAAAITFSRFPYEKNQKIPENRYTKWFDYDKIKGVLSVRTRQTGDYITLKGGSRKSVKSYMIDEKIPRQERDRILLLAEGSHVLWIVGYRISEYYKVTEETKEILQARAYGGEEYGREGTGFDSGRGCE